MKWSQLDWQSYGMKTLYPDWPFFHLYGFKTKRVEGVDRKNIFESGFSHNEKKVVLRYLEKCDIKSLINISNV